MIDSFHFSIVKKKNVIIIKEAVVKTLEESRSTEKWCKNSELSLFVFCFLGVEISLIDSKCC